MLFPLSHFSLLYLSPLFQLSVQCIHVSEKRVRVNEFLSDCRHNIFRYIRIGRDIRVFECDRLVAKKIREIPFETREIGMAPLTNFETLKLTRNLILVLPFLLSDFYFIQKQQE